MNLMNQLKKWHTIFLNSISRVYSVFSRKKHVQHGTLPPRHTLTVTEFAALEPFYRAQRPHDEVKTWRQLKAQGFKRIEHETLNMKYIVDSWNETYADMKVEEKEEVSV